jgi:hypothetical protein
MAETSGLWTTAAVPGGHAVVSYTQAIASDMLAIAAACSGFEGGAPGYSDELAPSSAFDNFVTIAAGGALVDGKFYKNTDPVTTASASASAGNYRMCKSSCAINCNPARNQNSDGKLFLRRVFYFLYYHPAMVMKAARKRLSFHHKFKR